MNHVSGYELLSNEISRYQALPYDDVSALIDQPYSHTVRKGGIDYEVTVCVAWYGEQGGDIVVRGSVREANWGSSHDVLEDSIVVKR
jgi:hypothetical protein